VCVALVLVLGIPAFAQPPDPNEIPFENTGTLGLVLVKVEVNGEPAVLIVDTGSNHTVISSELADITPSVWNNRVFSKKGSGFTGSGVYAKVTARVGTITWRDHQVVVMNMRDLSKSLGQKIDGMLGMDFFSGFDLVVVELKNHKLIRATVKRAFFAPFAESLANFAV
jgi:predicted aspartyl protease